jgi:hypothetical protein
LESSGEKRKINIPRRRGEGGEGRWRRRRGVYDNVFVDCSKPRGSRRMYGSPSVVWSSATEIATVAHKQRVNKQSATWWMTIGGQGDEEGNRREWEG